MQASTPTLAIRPDVNTVLTILSPSPPSVACIRQEVRVCGLEIKVDEKYKGASNRLPSLWNDLNMESVPCLPQSLHPFQLWYPPDMHVRSTQYTISLPSFVQSLTQHNILGGMSKISSMCGTQDHTLCLLFMFVFSVHCSCSCSHHHLCSCSCSPPVCVPAVLPVCVPAVLPVSIPAVLCVHILAVVHTHILTIICICTLATAPIRVPAITLGHSPFFSTFSPTISFPLMFSVILPSFLLMPLPV